MAIATCSNGISKTNMERAKSYVNEYIATYGKVKDSKNTDRYKRFVRTMARANIVDDEIVRCLYRDMFGTSGCDNGIPSWYTYPETVEKVTKKVAQILDVLTDEYVSLSDIVNKATKRSKHSHAPMDYERNKFKLAIKILVKSGCVNCVEIKTCGRTAIRLYSKVDW